MASVSSPGLTIIKERTRDGEITINLVLTIQLDGNNLSMAVNPDQNLEVAEDDIEFAIPDFETDDIIEFGRNVKE